MEKQIVGQAELVSVRKPFNKTRCAWEANGQRVMLGAKGSSKAPGCVVLCNVNGRDIYLDLQTGELYQFIEKV